MTYGQLPTKRPNKTLDNGAVLLSRQPVLYCIGCDASYSSDPGDYPYMPAGRTIKCGECDEPMILGEVIRTVVPVEKRDDILRAIGQAWGGVQDDEV